MVTRGAGTKEEEVPADANVETLKVRAEGVAAPSAGVKRRATLAAGSGARLRRLTHSRRAQLDGDEIVLAHDHAERPLLQRWRPPVQQPASRAYGEHQA